MDFAKRSLADLANIQIIPFEGLLADLVAGIDAEVIVKGLRAISDFEYEFQMAQINKKLKPEIETMFMVSNPSYAYLSSSAVKEVARFGGCITGLVPAEIEKEVEDSFRTGIFE